jgi:hypothetical protein
MIGFNGGLIGKANPTVAGFSIPGVWTSREQEVAVRTATWAGTGFLDLLPGAASAYSLRVLRQATINSPVVEVRRSSDDTLRNCTALEVIDGTLAAFCGANNGFVRTWYDQSGNANNASQTTNANQPQIIASGALILNNGRPVLRFNGTSHRFQQVGNVTINQPFTAILVGKRNADTPGLNQDLFRSITNQAVHFFNNTDSWNLYGFAGAAAKLGNTPIGTRFLSSVVYNGALSTNFFNGTQTTVDLGAAALNTANTLFIGSNANPGAFAAIDMPELIFYASSQSSNFTSINANINTFYGIY